jgi:hypothetical protein
MIFGESDSGGPYVRNPMPNHNIPISPVIAEWNAIFEEQKTREQHVETIKIDTNIFVGKIYQIASDERNSAEARVEAFKLVWAITMDRHRSGELSEADARDV